MGDRTTGQTATGQGEWVAQAEAARRLGVSAKTVERRRQSGDLLGEKRGRHWYVWWATTDATGADARPDEADKPPPPPDRLTTYLALRVEALEEENRRLQRELGEARGELRARLLLSGQAPTPDRTAATPAPVARTPWWRRLLGRFGR